MKLITLIKDQQKLSDIYRLNGRKIGFVPTMGFLHEGHLSLVRKAREDCDRVVVSIFVNPAQFGENEDIDRYPRDLERDRELLERENIDVIFFPDKDEMHSTGIKVLAGDNGLCAASRPGHFDGVLLVVSKLFNIVKPHKAYFGQKDLQQALLIQKMTLDLNFDIEIEIMPTVREHSGLAMSSRNTYLNPAEKDAAAFLYIALQCGTVRNARDILSREPLVKIDYIEIRDGYLYGAIYVGKTRLIDNVCLKEKKS